MNLQQEQKANIIIKNAYMQATFAEPLFVSTRFSYHQYEKHYQGAYTKEQIIERVTEIVKNLINIHFTGFKFCLELYHNRRKATLLERRYSCGF